MELKTQVKFMARGVEHNDVEDALHTELQELVASGLAKLGHVYHERYDMVLRILVEDRFNVVDMIEKANELEAEARNLLPETPPDPNSLEALGEKQEEAL